ncbi:MAG: BON domain-containing protein [bacterium]
MPQKDERVEAVRLSLRREPRLGPGLHLKKIEPAEDGAMIVEAEVERVAQKKIALERAAAVQGVTGIVDRIRVRPGSEMSDEDIRAHLCRALAGDRAFDAAAISEKIGEEVRTVRPERYGSADHILVESNHGVVILSGQVPGLASKRLAGVHAWWVPGSRDVVNGLAVEPPEEDGPDRIEEGVRIALERDPFVDAGRIRVGVRRTVVRLTGLVPSAAERNMAEADAWCVLGVDDVINEIRVAQL